MTILCEPDQHVVAVIAPSLVGVVRVVQSLPDAAMAVAEDPAEDLLVLGRDLPLDQVLTFAARVRDERPDLTVLLLREAMEPEELAAAADAGVREVVPANNLDLLTAACMRVRGPAVPVMVLDQPPLAQEPARHEPWSQELEAAAQAGSEPLPAGRVITVFSPKGGTGKTTISTNLAVALHSKGARRVCLLDLDLEFGDVAISLRLNPTRSLIDAVTTEVASSEDDVIAPLVTEYQPGLDCILAPIEPGAAEKIPVHIVSDLLALLRYRYDYVVVDTPSQFSENVLAALDASDHHLLLTNPEIPSLKNLRLTLDMLDLLGYSREIRSIVFNRADDAAGLSAADVEDSLKTPIAVHVPASRDVPASINRGVPIVAAHPDHAVSTAIRRFADAVIVGESLTRAKRSTLGRLFRRRSA